MNKNAYRNETIIRQTAEELAAPGGAGYVPDGASVPELAVRALLYEVCTTPKPGLVDRENSGSHRDMNIDTFIDSAFALQPYFGECVRIGQETCRKPAPETFRRLRPAGVRAEKDMYAATGGVNTHKGAVFSMGTVCAAIGRLTGTSYAVAASGRPAEPSHADAAIERPTGALHADASIERPTGALHAVAASGRPSEARPATAHPHPTAVLSECAAMTRGLVAADFAGLTPDSAVTTGQRLYLRYGITGIRGQAEAGFPAVSETGLPILKAGISMGISLNDAGCAALLALMCAATDTNLIARSSIDTQQRIVQEIRELLTAEPYPDLQTLRELDREFISRNLSPGGSADLLAISYLMYFLEAGTTLPLPSQDAP